ncbi:MAG: leucine-rich repeat domain-containing protein [Bacteroidaceae bacterium]|nr:leucine-rich repeat domain-containing protein [Bacteroidaceae bacterium]
MAIDECGGDSLIMEFFYHEDREDVVRYETDTAVYYLNVKTDRAMLVSYFGPSLHVAIPDVVVWDDLLEFRLISIGRGAFADNDSIKEVVIPEHVSYIGNGAFRGCTNLSEIKILCKPENISFIDFKGTKWYEQLPSGPVVIDYDYLFCYKDTVPSQYVIPDSIRRIGNDVFCRKSELNEVILHENVSWMGNAVFCGCTGLKEIMIPRGVKRIGDEAFSGCSSLKEIILSDGLEEIGYLAFWGCESLKEVEFPASLRKTDLFVNNDDSLRVIKLKGVSPSVFPDCFSYDPSLFEGESWSVFFSRCSLNIPRGTAEKYREATFWKQFATIIEETPVSSDTLLSCGFEQGESNYVINNTAIRPDSSTDEVRVVTEEFHAFDLYDEPDPNRENINYLEWKTGGNVNDSECKPDDASLTIGDFILKAGIPYCLDYHIGSDVWGGNVLIGVFHRTADGLVPVSGPMISPDGYLSNSMFFNQSFGLSSVMFFSDADYDDCCLRLSFVSPGRTFRLDDVTLCENKFCNVLIGGDLARIEFAYPTNIGDMASAVPCGTVEVPSDYFSITGEIDGEPYVYDILSGEYHSDGRLYVWIEDDSFVGLSNIRISFTNPAEETGLALKYIESINAETNDTVWRRIPDIVDLYAGDNTSSLSVSTMNYFKSCSLDRYINNAPSDLDSVAVSFQKPLQAGSETRITAKMAGLDGSEEVWYADYYDEEYYSVIFRRHPSDKDKPLQGYFRFQIDNVYLLEEPVSFSYTVPVYFGDTLQSVSSNGYTADLVADTIYYTVQPGGAMVAAREVNREKFRDNFGFDGPLTPRDPIAGGQQPRTPMRVHTMNSLGTGADTVLVDYAPYSGNLVIPESVSANDTTYRVVGTDYYAFIGCTELETVSFPESVTTLGYGSFAGCIGLKGVNIPSGVGSVPDAMFYGCTSLDGVVLPEGIVTIGHSAFYNCSGLTEIVIPASVELIDEYAFFGCTGLKRIVIEGNPEIAPTAFMGVPTEVVVLLWKESGILGGNPVHYSPDGRIISADRPGLHIIKAPDGSVSKVLVR